MFMPRIKIQLPDNFGFYTVIPVRITDLNYGNHVGNDSILSLIHEARVQFLAHHGLAELEFEGVSLIMSDVGIEYKAELQYGAAVKIYVAAENLLRVSFDLYYKLVNEANGIVIATAKTGMVCFDYDQKKIVALPEKAREKLIAA